MYNINNKIVLHQILCPMCSLLKAIQFGYLIKQKVNSDKFMDTCSNFAYILSSRLKLQILKYMAL